MHSQAQNVEKQPMDDFRMSKQIELVQRFICLIGIFSVGTLVQLESVILAILITLGIEILLRPIVQTVLEVKRNLYTLPHDINLKNKLDSIVQNESPKDWGIDPFKCI
jgi:hypothetical protein